VIIEDYLKCVFGKEKDYQKYEGAEFIKLLRRQRELPFGAKLQLHKFFMGVVEQGYLNNILDEIVLQSKLEFNYQDEIF